MLELFANAAQTVLVGSIDNVTSTVIVSSSSRFPVAVTGVSQFRVLCEAEVMTVTNVASTTWTVTRGAEGTTKVSHANGVAITHVLTAGAIANLADTAGVEVGAASWDVSRARVVTDFNSFFGIDSTGAAYFNDAGVASGDEAALFVDPITGRFILTKVDAP